MKDYGSLSLSPSTAFQRRDKRILSVSLIAYAAAFSALSALLLFSGNIAMGKSYTVLEDPGYVDWLKGLVGPVEEGAGYERADSFQPAALPTTRTAGNLQGVDFAADTFPLDEEFVNSDPSVGFYVPKAICKFSGCYGAGNPQAYTLGPSSFEEDQQPDTRSSVFFSNLPDTVTDAAFSGALARFSPSSTTVIRGRRDSDGGRIAVASFPTPAAAARAASALSGQTPFGGSRPLYSVPMDPAVASVLTTPPVQDGPPPAQDEFPGVHLDRIDPDITGIVAGAFDRPRCNCPDDDK
jgi:hypothetical protein